jgi:hypothetical protein
MPNLTFTDAPVPETRKLGRPRTDNPFMDIVSTLKPGTTAKTFTLPGTADTSKDGNLELKRALRLLADASKAQDDVSVCRQYEQTGDHVTVTFWTVPKITRTRKSKLPFLYLLDSPEDHPDPQAA